MTTPHRIRNSLLPVAAILVVLLSGLAGRSTPQLAVPVVINLNIRTFGVVY